MIPAFRRLWWPLLATDILAKALVLGVLAPVVALVLRLFLSAGGGGGVVADHEIAYFLLSPLGVLTVAVVGGLILLVTFVEHAALVCVALLGSTGDTVRPMDALALVVRRLRELFVLGLRIFGGVALLALPFLLVLAGIFLGLLSDHDINYYLAFRPPAWRLALLFALVAAMVFSVLLARLLAAWILAIPLTVLGESNGKDALRRSREAMRGRVWQVVAVALVMVVATALAGWTLTELVQVAGRVVAGDLAGRLGIMAAALMLLLALDLLGGAVLSWLLASALGLVVADFSLALDPGIRSRVAGLVVSSEDLRDGSLAVSVTRRRVAVVAVLLALLLVTSVSAVRDVLVRMGPGQPVAVIAHRGSSADAPENTMSAVDLAIGMGSDWVEIDVQETRDGQVVVIHDQDLMRVAGDPRRINSSSYPEIRDLDVGSWFAPEFSEERLPLLEEVLEAARGRAGVLVELKYYGDEKDLEARVVEVVERAGMQDQVMFMSLKYEGIQALAALRPEWVTGFLVATAVGDVTRRGEVDFLAVNSGMASVPFVRRAHQAGQKVFVWTVNAPRDMIVMAGKGVDGVITDRPDVARRVGEVRNSLSNLERWVFLLANALDVLPSEPPAGIEDA